MNNFEFIILFASFAVCLSLVWSSLRSGITPVPSSNKAKRTILQAADRSSFGTIIELGSGWGTLALALAEKHPHRQVIGYEISPIPWFVSWCLKKIKRLDNLNLRRQNFISVELPPSTLLVCYLYPGGMSKLAEKIEKEKPQVEILISNTFALPGVEPEQVIRLRDLYKSPIYVYRLVGSDIEK
ncbi:Putative methyltransferase [Malonomonas rubra DSM 5091]|uniref:tRNA (guanine(46)-N(7))-methyltransferase n=1 Tax=Malonomonas rubra DSM 5091 TaxID=1122189 RepID=A0A1M6C370_MALRU|nr:class I SAM-dependent methyltransferase [Malonomonas rubra]SHI55148.1 Putative methyltransferase [Malonomonas rubra DSM 5091]